MSKMFGKNKVLLNISGHPLSDVAEGQAKDCGLRIVDIKVPNVDVKDPKSVLEYIKTVFETIAGSNKIIGLIKKNKFIVIPPGLGILCSGIIAMLHGISGSFPKQAWLIRDDDGVYKFELDDDGKIKTDLDLQKVRIQYRDFRRP